MSKDKEKILHFNAKLTKEEGRDLDRISKRILGYKNRSMLIRYWINEAKKTMK